MVSKLSKSVGRKNWLCTKNSCINLDKTLCGAKQLLNINDIKLFPKMADSQVSGLTGSFDGCVYLDKLEVAFLSPSPCSYKFISEKPAVFNSSQLT